MNERAPVVAIVGGGFAGLSAAKALRKAPVEIVLIDRSNHHLFQPLLYQVATSVLTPGQIASPIRGILRGQKNTTVVLAEVSGVDPEARCVIARAMDDDVARDGDGDEEAVRIPYDFLILATGVGHNYFG